MPTTRPLDFTPAMLRALHQHAVAANLYVIDLALAVTGTEEHGAATRVVADLSRFVAICGAAVEADPDCQMCSGFGFYAGDPCPACRMDAYGPQDPDAYVGPVF